MKTMTRGGFLRMLGAAGATSALGGCVGLGDAIAGAVDDVRTVARLGVMANTEVGWITEATVLRKAFAYYRQSKVDAVVIAGKATKNGYDNQADVLRQVWESVFGTDGTPPRLIAEPGEYEVNGFKFAVSGLKPFGACDVITFHGGGKAALTDELGHYPTDAKSVYAGSMSGVIPPDGFEVLGKDGKGGTVEKTAQGLLVSAYSGRTVVRRLDFTQKTPEEVADPWILGAERKEAKVPEFWPDTTIQVIAGYSGAKRVYTVKWPKVLKRFTGARAFSYEVAAEPAEGGKPYAVRKVLSPAYHLSEDRDGGALSVQFGEAVFPKGAAVRFAVTPCDSLCRAGKTFRSDVMRP